MHAAINGSRSAHAVNTRRAYQSDWSHFSTWCEQRRFANLPAAAETVAIYVSDLASNSALSTLRRRLVTIARVHAMAGHSNPVARTVVHRTMRDLAHAFMEQRKTVQRAMPLLLEDLQAMLARMPKNSARGKRDRALLLLGFAGAFRRSKLVALDVEDIVFSREGAIAHVDRSRTDQDGVGHQKVIPFGKFEETCPVRALKSWLEAAGISQGPLFRPIRKGGAILEDRLSDKAVSLILKENAARAGLDAERISAHSLRSGFVTVALSRGATYAHVQRQTGHRSPAMVGAYDRDSTRIRENAVMMLGL